MKKLREEINIIDQSMQNLFIERMQVVKKIALYKVKNNIPVMDSKREAEIIEKNVNRINDFHFKDLYKDFYKKILNISVKYQERILENK